MSQTLFVESQQFRQPWLWGVLLLVFLAVSGATFVTVRQAAATGAKAILGIVTLLVLAVIALLYTSELKTEVKPDGLYVRFFPLQTSATRIAPEELKTAEAVEYNPMRDYGGWGIRQGSAGKAYSIGGDRGVRLTFRDPRRRPAADRLQPGRSAGGGHQPAPAAEGVSLQGFAAAAFPSCGPSSAGRFFTYVSSHS